MPVAPARRVAFEILERVATGAHASDVLRVRTKDLSSRDAGLAEEIVYGVLRFQAQLDFLVKHYSGRDPAKLDLEVLQTLRMGIYQLRYLDRVPAHAAVDESVDLVKSAGKSSASGFVNAVLRKVDRSPVEWPNRSVALSHPEWLLDNWSRLFGQEGAAGIARAFLSPPEAYVRIPEERGAEAQSLAVEETDVPGCYRLLSGAPGPFRQQDIGSQAIVPLLELAPGQTFLDLCAAPGNKTAQALEGSITAVAADVSLPRLRGLQGLEARLVNLDATRGLPFRRPFDRILVDAPCSGTGTLGRNPEIKWRVQPEDLKRHHERQALLLSQGLRALAPGGRLVYATCSLEYEENEQVVEEALESQPPDIGLEHQLRRIPGADPGDGFYAAVLTRADESGVIPSE